MTKLTARVTATQQHTVHTSVNLLKRHKNNNMHTCIFVVKTLIIIVMFRNIGMAQECNYLNYIEWINTLPCKEAGHKQVDHGVVHVTTIQLHLRKELVF